MRFRKPILSLFDTNEYEYIYWPTNYYYEMTQIFQLQRSCRTNGNDQQYDGKKRPVLIDLSTTLATLTLASNFGIPFGITVVISHRIINI